MDMDVAVSVGGAVAGAAGVLLIIGAVAPEFLRLLVEREPRPERVRARSERIMARNGEVAERRALHRLALRVRRGALVVIGFSIMGCAAAPEQEAALVEAAAVDGHDPLVMEWVEYLRREFPGYSEKQYLLEADRFARMVGGGVCDSTYTRVLFDGRSIPC